MDALGALSVGVHEVYGCIPWFPRKSHGVHGCPVVSTDGCPLVPPMSIGVHGHSSASIDVQGVPICAYGRPMVSTDVDDVILFPTGILGFLPVGGVYERSRKSSIFQLVFIITHEHSWGSTEMCEESPFLSLNVHWCP